MRLRNFLIICGIWITLLPHIGFSIITENVLLSITGFVFIVSSFYIAAIEDKHKHKRIIKEETLYETSQKLGEVFKKIQKTSTLRNDNESIKNQAKISRMADTHQKKENKILIEDDGPPRIQKAVSDVRIKIDSVDDIVF